MFKPDSRFFRVLVFACLFLLPLFSALAMEETCPPSMDAVVTLASGEKELNICADTEKAERVGKLKKGDLIAMCAFGGGLSSAACLIRW